MKVETHLYYLLSHPKGITATLPQVKQTNSVWYRRQRKYSEPEFHYGLNHLTMAQENEESRDGSLNLGWEQIHSACPKATIKVPILMKNYIHRMS